MTQKTLKTIIIISLLLCTLSTTAYLQETAVEEETYPTIDGLIHEGEYSNNYLSEIGLEIFWEFGPEKLYMALRGPSTGWIAIGFDPSNRMNHAKIIMASLQEDQVVLEEHIGTGPISHTRREESYIKEYQGSTHENILIEFIIPLDEDSIYQIQEGEEYTIILGFHQSSQNLFTRHTHRETINLTL